MGSANYIGSTDTTYILTKLKQVLEAGYVAKDGDKVLSDENYTTAEKTKLSGIQENATAVSWNQIQAEGTKIATITINGNDTDVYVEEITIDDEVSDSSENPVQNKVIKAYVDDAIEGIVGVEFRKVEELPEEGENGVIYLVPKSGTQPEDNIYEEWIWIESDSKYEKIGETTIDLSGYVQDSDLVKITTSDIDDMFDEVFGNNNNS